MKILSLFIFLILVCSSVALADDKGVFFNPDTNYDVYFSNQGNGAFILRRVKIIEQGEEYLVVKSDRALGAANSRGYVFMKGVYSVVPSDYFQIDTILSCNK